MKPSAILRSAIFLCLFCAANLVVGIETSAISCGERLTASTGIVNTPNFPRPFAVPITCRWVIDVSDILSTNSSVVVYLTQLYVYKGLKLTEYAYYESETMNFGASLIAEVTEGNVFLYRWFRTFRPFLVVEFQLDRLEGNHVRVQDGLLDVYGFNVTYQTTEDEPNQDSCSVSACSFNGNCLLSTDRSTFECECFSGFSGRNCNEGPLCFDEQRPICRNEGTLAETTKQRLSNYDCPEFDLRPGYIRAFVILPYYANDEVCKFTEIIPETRHYRQIGAKTVRCICPTGYTGRYCDVQLLDTFENECKAENCILQCPFIEEEERPCSCKNGTKIYNNRSRYECRIKLANVTSLRSGLIAQHGNLESFVGKLVSKSCRWPLQVFFNILDLAGINAWILYKETTGENISRQEFLFQLASELGEAYTKSKEKQLLPTPSTNTDLCVRKTCQIKFCKGYKTTKICSKCEKYVCGKCTFQTKLICKQCDEAE